MFLLQTADYSLPFDKYLALKNKATTKVVAIRYTVGAVQIAIKRSCEILTFGLNSSTEDRDYACIPNTKSRIPMTISIASTTLRNISGLKNLDSAVPAASPMITLGTVIAYCCKTSIE